MEREHLSATAMRQRESSLSKACWYRNLIDGRKGQFCQSNEKHYAMQHVYIYFLPTHCLKYVCKNIVSICSHSKTKDSEYSVRKKIFQQSCQGTWEETDYFRQFI